MKVRIELTEEVTEIYEVEYDGDIQDFDPTDYMAREYLVSSKVGNSDYTYDYEEDEVIEEIDWGAELADIEKEK